MQSAAPDDAALDFASIFATLARGKWIILVTCILVAGSVAGYTYTLPSVYQASSMVRIDPQSNTPPSISNTSAIQPTTDPSSEMGVLRNSIELAKQVARKLKATDEADGPRTTFPILTNPRTGESLPEHEVGERILNKASFSASQQDRNIISISVESQTPEEASTIVNLYAEAYKTFSLERARSSITAARQFLEQQAEKQRQKIQQLEQQWESFAKDNQVVVQGEGGERLAQQYQSLQARRDNLSFELERERTQLELLRQQLQQFQPRLEEDILENQQASSLRSEIEALEERIAQMRVEAAQYYAVHPNLEGDSTRIRREFPDLASVIQEMDALQSRKRTLTQRLIAETNRSSMSGMEGAPLERVAQLRSRITEKEIAINQLESQVTALDSQIAEYEPRLSNIPQQRIQREQLERRMMQAESFLETIVGELQRTTVAEEAELGYVEIVRRAVIPRVPVRPNTRQNVILGLLLGIGFGVGIAFLREATNSQLRHPEDIETKGYTLLGVVPTMDAEIDHAFGGRDFVTVGERELSTRLLPVLHPWSSIAENYRLIRTNLQKGKRNEPHIFLVTSAQEREGKTTTAANLALTAALSGQRALLIDADLRRPTLHTVLGSTRAPGLSDLLTSATLSNGKNGMSDEDDSLFNPTSLKGASCIHRSVVDGLFVVPAGGAEPPPTEQLSSEHMQQFIDTVHPHFDIVLIDTPPTQAASDAVVIGAHTEARALVVSAQESDRRALDAVIGAHRRVDTPVAGVIFNRFDRRKDPSHNGYGYSYYDDDDYYSYHLASTGALEQRKP